MITHPMQTAMTRGNTDFAIPDLPAAPSNVCAGARAHAWEGLMMLGGAVSDGNETTALCSAAAADRIHVNAAVIYAHAMLSTAVTWIHTTVFVLGLYPTITMITDTALGLIFIISLFLLTGNTFWNTAGTGEAPSDRYSSKVLTHQLSVVPPHHI